MRSRQNRSSRGPTDQPDFDSSPLGAALLQETFHCTPAVWAADDRGPVNSGRNVHNARCRTHEGFASPISLPGQTAMPSTSPDGQHDRTVFYVSDGTGITAETFGHALLTQFSTVRLRGQRLPFVDSADKAQEAVTRINRQAQLDRHRPLVFST
ncbi:MAG: putative phosphotransferase ydiA, partial [Pseudomonadota bacterium]